MKSGIPEAYSDLANWVFARWQRVSENTRASDVAEAVRCAANDPSTPIRMLADVDAVEWAGPTILGLRTQQVVSSRVYGE